MVSLLVAGYTVFAIDMLSLPIYIFVGSIGVSTLLITPLGSLGAYAILGSFGEFLYNSIHPKTDETSTQT